MRTSTGQAVSPLCLTACRDATRGSNAKRAGAMPALFALAGYWQRSAMRVGVALGNRIAILRKAWPQGRGCLLLQLLHSCFPGCRRHCKPFGRRDRRVAVRCLPFKPAGGGTALASAKAVPMPRATTAAAASIMVFIGILLVSGPVGTAGRLGPSSAGWVRMTVRLRWRGDGPCSLEK